MCGKDYTIIRHFTYHNHTENNLWANIIRTLEFWTKILDFYFTLKRFISCSKRQLLLCGNLKSSEATRVLQTADQNIFLNFQLRDIV